jgi:hypothetical protein
LNVLQALPTSADHSSGGCVVRFLKLQISYLNTLLKEREKNEAEPPIEEYER